MSHDPFTSIARDFAQNIADGRFDRVRYYPGRTTQDELIDTLREYGRRFIPIPDEGLEEIAVLKPFADENRWLVDLPLWTEEEGRSDMCLYLIVLEENGEKVGYLDHVKVP